MRKVVISSPLATQSGYGHHAREFVTNVLEQMTVDDKWDVKLLSMPWGGTPFTYPIPLHWREKMIGLPLKDHPDIWVQITVPNEFESVGQYNIGVTAATEGDICPKEWIECINRMNLIVVPSQFTKGVFVKTAKDNNLQITCKIEVISEYFRESVYDCKNVIDEIKELDDIPEQWAFLAVGHWLQGEMGEDRKNISGLIHTFFTTYKNKKDKPALILKSSGATYSVPDRFMIQNKINQIQEMFGPNIKLPPVYLLHGDLSDTEMNALYNHKKVKAMVSFTKAEGFGRPLLEFSTTGKPIIAPHYSGQVDFLKEDFICKLPGNLTPIHKTAQNDFLIGDAKWLTIDYGYASKMMLDVQKNYRKWLELGKRQRYFVNQNFSKSKVKKQYTALFDIIESETQSIPQQVDLKLPKLNLPKLEKQQKELPKLKLPKLKKVTD